MHFEIYRSSGTEAAQTPGKPWKWRLVAEDGAAVAHGEGYASSEECERIVMLVRASNPETPIRYG